MVPKPSATALADPAWGGKLNPQEVEVTISYRLPEAIMKGLVAGLQSTERAFLAIPPGTLSINLGLIDVERTHGISIASTVHWRHSIRTTAF